MLEDLVLLDEIFKTLVDSRASLFAQQRELSRLEESVRLGNLASVQGLSTAFSDAVSNAGFA